MNQELLEKTLRNRLKEDMEQYRVSGAHLLVLQKGKEITNLCGGFLNWDTKEPLRQDAIYRLASMTKPVTGVAALIAESKGYFQIDDLLEEHMPEFADMYVAKLENGKVVPDKKNGTPLRIRHLLTHCNGMMSQDPVGSQMVAAIPKTAFQSLEAMTSYAATQMLAFEPETRCAYSGRAAFDVAARLIEIKSGMSYADFIRENIFAPLGLRDFTYHPTEEQWERTLVLTDRTGTVDFVTTNVGKSTYERNPLTYTCAGAGLVASMADYAVFAEMLRNGGTYKGVQILRPEQVEKMTHPYIDPGVPGRNASSSWGLGVRVVDRKDVLPMGAFGWSGAYGTHFWVDPVNEITAIYMRGSRWYDSHGRGKIGFQFEKDVMAALED